MPLPTGTNFPGALDGVSNGYGAVSDGQVIYADYANDQTSAIIALETVLGSTPLTGTPYSTVGAALAGLVAALQDGSFTYATDSGTANAYAVTLSPTPPAYAAGQMVAFKAAHANTGASTLAVNGATAQHLYKNGSTALSSGDIFAGQVMVAIYDGTNFQLVGGLGSGGGGGGSLTESFLTVNAESSLADSRQMTAGSGIHLTDGGAGSTLAIANTLTTGLSGGQTIMGDTASGGNLALLSTGNTTLGTISLNSATTVGPDGTITISGNNTSVGFAVPVEMGFSIQGPEFLGRPSVEISVPASTDTLSVNLGLNVSNYVYTTGPGFVGPCFISSYDNASAGLYLEPPPSPTATITCPLQMNGGTPGVSYAADPMFSVYIYDGGLLEVHESGGLDSQQGTITTNAPGLSISQTWNNSETTFEAMVVDVTNSASAGASRVADFQLSGTSQFSIDGKGNVLVGSAALATSATNGFPYLPSGAGAPTGTPTSFTGLVPLYLDTTNDKLWAYLGGAWKGVTLS